MGIIRPVFIADPAGVRKLDVEFKWEGLSEASVWNLHNAVYGFSGGEIGTVDILEASGYSPSALGRNLSAFSLMITPDYYDYSSELSSTASVESLYQGSKVFENGKQYKDLYYKSSLVAKKDKRLKTSGALIGFNFEGKNWGLNDHFYEWLYLSALAQNPELAESVEEYDAFTDICFGKNSFNCQAYALAVYKSALMKGYDDINSIVSKIYHT